MRRVGVWFAALALVCAGCGALPTSGQVEQHEQAHEQPEGEVEIAPEPPAPGASPLLIVEGFLHASATPQQDYKAAREYLTEEASAEWQPDSGIRVYTTGAPRLAGDHVVLETTLAGSVDSRGSYTARTTALVHDFGLIRRDGQWRIGHPPSGVLVSSYLFRNSYRSAAVYFPDASGDVLVPDAVIAHRAEPSARAVVSRVFAGPSRWLSAAVAPVVDEEGSLEVLDVSVDDSGVVDVTVSDDATHVGEESRTLLAAQLAWTLMDFGYAQGVRLRTGEEVLSVPDADANGVVRTSAVAELAPASRVRSHQLFGLVDEQVSRVNEDSAVLNSTPTSWQTADITALAVNADAMKLAAVSDSAELTIGYLAGGEQVARVDKFLIRPQFIRGGALWSYGHAGFEAWDDDSASAISADGLAERRVMSFRVSPDGVRVAVVFGTGATTKLGVLRVVSGAGGVSLTGLRVIDLGADKAPHDVGWRGASTLAVSYDSSGTSGVVTTDVAGAMITDQNLPSSKSGATIASLSRLDSSELVVCDQAGTCSRFVSDQRWITLTGSVREPAYPS